MNGFTPDQIPRFKIRYRTTRGFIDWSQLEEIESIGIPETAKQIEAVLKIAARNLLGREELANKISKD